MKNRNPFLSRSISVLLSFVALFVPFLTEAQEISLGQFMEDISNISAYPFLRNGVACGMQSSYDRSGGNDDGFNGKYSTLRKENGNSVITEIEGAGVITRIWFPYDQGYDSPMFLRNKRIFIYLDGNSTPVVDMPIIEMFDNSNIHFPYPLCGMSLGGCWCHVPIPFQKGAKIVVEGEKVGFFHVQYNQYPEGMLIQTFNFDHNPLINEPGRIMDIFWNLGDLDYLGIKDSTVIKSQYTLKSGENELSFPNGPAILHAIIVKGAPLELEKFLDGHLNITWDNGKSPAINVPLSMFFIQERAGLKGKSLLAGILQGGGGVYNFFPMPYQNRARIKLTIPRKCKVEIITVFERLKRFNPDLCYLHINHVKDFPTTPGAKHIWLNVNGEGHFVGVYMRAEGKSLSTFLKGTIYWTPCLEGDQVFEVDGKMVQHGTGTEDYFNAGWNGMFGRLDHAQTFPFHGYTLFNAGKVISSTAAYRWHLPTEVIPFKKHFEASIEVGPTDNLKGNYESIVFYYLTIPDQE